MLLRLRASVFSEASGPDRLSARERETARQAVCNAIAAIAEQSLRSQHGCAGGLTTLQRLKRFPQAHAAISGGELAQLIYRSQFFFARAVGEMNSRDRFSQWRRKSPRWIFFELSFQ